MALENNKKFFQKKNPREKKSSKFSNKYPKSNSNSKNKVNIKSHKNRNILLHLIIT